MTANADVNTAATGEQCGLTVFHDGSCALCRREIAIAQTMTAGCDVAFVDVSNREGEAVAPGLNADVAMRRFHVRRADGTLLSGAAAFIELWARTPRLAWLKRLSRWPFVVRTLDAVYSGILVIRPPLSRLVNRVDTWGAS